MNKREILKVHKALLDCIHEVEFLPTPDDFEGYPKDIRKDLERMLINRTNEIIREKSKER